MRTESENQTFERYAVTNGSQKQNLAPKRTTGPERLVLVGSGVFHEAV